MPTSIQGKAQTGRVSSWLSSVLRSSSRRRVGRAHIAPGLERETHLLLQISLTRNCEGKTFNFPSFPSNAQSREYDPGFQGRTGPRSKVLFRLS